MKKITFQILLLLITVSIYGQGRIVFNNNSYINIENNAFLVIDNPNPNAISLLGSGGNIISEGENNVIKWNIGLTTGSYLIPWTTLSGVKIPFSMNKNNSGVGSGNVIFATYETATDMNTPWPSTVTHMSNNLISPVDNSLSVVDRFWRVNANNYTTKPSISMTFNYDPSPNEIGGMNTLIEDNLRAQRWNTDVGDWESLLFGINDAANDRVSNVNIGPSDFYDFWILVDKTVPLPVTLLDFEANCELNKIVINWSTQTEINNDFFVLEKSYDALDFFELETVQGSGSSNVNNYYSVVDQNISTEIVYYRLKQVDFNGAITYHKIITTKCNKDEFTINGINIRDNELNFNIITSKDEQIIIYFYDYTGKIISKKNRFLTDGINRIKLSNLQLSTSVYMLSIVGKQNSYSTKLFVK